MEGENNQVVGKRQKIDGIFGSEPTHFRCPYCNNNIVTIIEYENSYLSYLLCFIIIFIAGLFLSILIIPIVLVLTKSLVHKCSICWNALGSDGKIFHSLEIKDRVISLKFGEIGFILTRKLIAGVLLGAVLFAIIIFKINNLGNMDFDEPMTPTYKNWDEFRKKCGREVLRDNRNIAFCVEEHLDKTVINWSGYIIRVNDYRETMYRYMHHAVTILVKMQPSELESMPDLVLTLDSDKASKYTELISALDRGQEIGFNATLKSMGGEMQTRHFHLRQIWKMPGFMEVPPHVHDDGRYADKPRLIRNVKMIEEKEKFVESSEKKPSPDTSQEKESEGH